MTAPATFELEFIFSGQRYAYRFATDGDGVTEESLHVVSTRWKEVFVRNADGRVKGLKGYPTLPDVNLLFPAPPNSTTKP